jgi:hypothetical protein
MDEPFKCDDPKTASFKVKSAPAKGLVSAFIFSSNCCKEPFPRY